MTTSLHPAIATKKAMEIQSALFFNQSTSLIKIKNQVIHALYADETGHVWFCIPSPFACMCEADMEFAANLDFFKKEKEFYLKIAGNACMINKDEALDHLQAISPAIKQNIINGESVLIKLKIKNAGYFERQPGETIFLFREVKDMLYKWFLKWGNSNFKKLPVNNFMKQPGIFLR